MSPQHPTKQNKYHDLPKTPRLTHRPRSGIPGTNKQTKLSANALLQAILACHSTRQYLTNATPRALTTHPPATQTRRHGEVPSRLSQAC